MAAMVLGCVLFAYYALRYAPDEVPEYLAVLAIMYLFRAVLIVLTPLAHARGEGPPAFPLFQNGMFPSGHTAAALLFAWMTDARRAPRLRRAQYVLLAVVVVCLVISHGHYSIDIVGGALLAYFVHREWTSGTLFATVKRFMGIA
jgi:membrane-associated phospholipid phosphatase